MDNSTNIYKLINFDEFQFLQDSIAQATNLALITIDYKGNPLTKHSNCSEFCNLVRQNPLSSKYCQKCDSRGGLEAVRQNKPYAYLCHYNLVDLAVPIIVENKYIGAVMAGQVKLTNLPNDCELEQIISKTGNSSLIMNISAYSQAYDKIPFIDYDSFEKFAKLISSTLSYIIKESLGRINAHKPAVLSDYEKNFYSQQFNGSYKHNNAANNYSYNIKSKNEVLTPKTINYESAKLLIQPLLTYINENPTAFLSSNEAAQYCNITSSYFSKIFKKVMTIGYTEYINQLKIAWAKELLVETNSSVEKISEKLGFNSTSYFIKTFKIHENLTPTLYRKYYSSFKDE